MKLAFGDMVVTSKNHIGVVVKCWRGAYIHEYDIYNRMTNHIETYDEDEIERYMVRHKYLDEDETAYQQNALK